MTRTPLLSTAQVAEWLALSVPTVRNLVRSGQLGAYKVAGKWRYQEEAVAELLDRSPVYGTDAKQKQKRRGHAREKGDDGTRT